LSKLFGFFGNRENDRGQSIVEFSLLLPIMLLIITGLFDVARAVWQTNTLAYAAREGTRYAIVHGSAGNPAADADFPNCGGATPDPVICVEIPRVVRQASIGLQNITVTVTYPDYIGPTRCAERNCRVIVDATAPFVPLPSQYLLGSAYQMTLRGGSQLVIQR
jgi:Flp pilus assembly protein TadG